MDLVVTVAPPRRSQVELQAKSKAATACMGSDWLKIFEGEAHACTINSLRPGCAYRVRVRARNVVGWGQWALPVDLTTASDAPEVPQSLQPASCTPTTIVITWAPPRHDGGSKVHTYRMEMASADCVCGRCPHNAAAPAAPGQAPRPTLCPGHTPLAVYAAEAVGAELRHLQPGCRYIFRVQVGVCMLRACTCMMPSLGRAKQGGVQRCANESVGSCELGWGKGTKTWAVKAGLSCTAKRMCNS